MAAALTIEQAAAELRAGTTTSGALTERLLGAISAANEELGAFVTVTSESALAAAARADAELASGRDRGPLHGIPVAVKDIIATADAPTTANSRALGPDWGGGADAPVVRRLRDAGAVIVGKSTTSEFALSELDPTKKFLIPRNPWNLAVSPSGSSSGTGVAVAAGLALGGLGSDTGGSIRGPAAANAVTGLKPTFGLVPKSGVVPLASSLDSIGPLARSARDCALLLDAIAGFDASDPCSAPDQQVAAYATAGADITGLRIGVPTAFFFDAGLVDGEVLSAVLAAVDLLARHGAQVREIDIPDLRQARFAGHVVLIAEAYAWHRENLRRRWQDYGANTRVTLARGALYTSGDYVQAGKVGSAFRRTLDDVFEQVDIIVAPTLPGPPPPAGQSGIDRSVVQPRFAEQWNLAGVPALAVPCGFTAQQLPISMQLAGPQFTEARLLAAGARYQELTDWHLRLAPHAWGRNPAGPAHDWQPA